MEIVIATNNQGKVNEFIGLLEKKGYLVKSLKNFPEIDEIEETGTTFEENAVIKAEFLSNHLNCTVISDDSGLEVDALNGEPGVYSARYAGEQKNDEDNINKVLQKLEGVKSEERGGRFVCAMALATPGQPTRTFRGTCEGKILKERKGSNGFGYDPIFLVNDLECSMAELTKEEKGKISHRSKALFQLMSYFESKE